MRFVSVTSSGADGRLRNVSNRERGCQTAHATDHNRMPSQMTASVDADTVGSYRTWSRHSGDCAEYPPALENSEM